MAIITRKNSGEKLAYEIDWSPDLATGDDIASVSFTPPAGLTKESESSSGQKATVVFSGGTAGETYQVAHSVTTVSGAINTLNLWVLVPNLVVVEDGSVVAGANSYVSETELAGYMAVRNASISGDLTASLLKAMDYLETLSFAGNKYSETQALQWPRYSVYIDGYPLSSSDIPNELKQAQMRLAHEIDQGNDPLETLARKVKREKVGPVEVEYDDSSASAAILRSVNNMLRKILSTTSGNAFYVSR